MRILLRWVKANGVMLINSASLVGTTAVTSGVGFVYWWVATRQCAPEAVGFASAAVSTMMLLSSMAMLGLGTLLITELPRQPTQAVSLISTGLVVVAGVGLVIGIAFAGIAPSVSAQFAPLRASLLNVLIFAAGISLAAVTAVLDQALIGLLQGNLQFGRNAFFSVAKLALLFAAGLYLSQTNGMTIYTSWTLGMALSLLVVFAHALFKKGWQGKAYLPQWKLLRKLGAAALQHHFLNLVLQVPTQLLPVLVIILLSAKVNAWFYISWMIAQFVFLVPNSLTIVLHAMNSADQASLRQRARMTVGVSLLFSLLADAVLLLGTKQVLGVFGKVYADQAAWCLRILVLAAFTGIIKTHYISFCRIRDRVGQAMFGMLLGGALELVGAALGGYMDGLIGLSLGWVIATAVEGLFMFPVVYRVIWSAKGLLEEPLPEQYGETEPIWLLDTVMLAAIPPRHTTGRVPVPLASTRPLKPVWLVETTAQPTIPPSPLIQESITHLPIERKMTEPLWKGKAIRRTQLRPP